MRKKIISLVLIGVMACSLTGCGVFDTLLGLSDDKPTSFSSVNDLESGKAYVASLDDYLKGLFCNGCGRHCSLLSPQCGKGERKAEQATAEYYNTYSSENCNFMFDEREADDERNTLY